MSFIHVWKGKTSWKVPGVYVELFELLKRCWPLQSFVQREPTEWKSRIKRMYSENEHVALERKDATNLVSLNLVIQYRRRR
jgi:hypothetical protein